MQLQKSSAEFKALGLDVLSVHREEKLGAAGLEKTAKKSGATYHLTTDLGNKSTAAYSTKGFDTYIIHKDGTVLAIFDGKKFDRPTAEEILAKAREVLPKPTAK